MCQIAVVGQPEGMMSVGSDMWFFVGFCLFVFERARGLDDEDWTSEAYNDFLAAAVNLW